MSGPRSRLFSSAPPTRIKRDESAAAGTADTVVFAGGTSAQEYINGASTPAVEYIRGSDYGGGVGGVLYTLRSGTARFNAYNSRGDVVVQTDATGTLSYESQYEAHGTRTAETAWAPEIESTLNGVVFRVKRKTTNEEDKKNSRTNHPYPS